LSDDVFIATGGNYQVTLDSDTIIRSLVLGNSVNNGTQTLRIIGSSIMLTNGGIVLNSGRVVIEAGTIQGTGSHNTTLSVSGLVEFHDVSTNNWEYKVI